MNDWVEHSKFGIGQITAIGDNLSIRFLKEGEKILVKTAEAEAGESAQSRFSMAEGPIWRKQGESFAPSASRLQPAY